MVVDMKPILYDDQLGKEWIDWVESAAGSREQEIYPLIKEWLSDTKPKELVDIGCGQGACSTLVADEIGYTGVDQSPVLIKRAKELYPARNFLIGDAYKIPAKDDSFDAAMSIWVWSHIKNLELAAKDMRRTLNHGGKFLIVTASPYTYEERKTFYTSYKEKDGLLIGDFDLGEGKVLSNSTLYLHSLDKIKKSILEAGLLIDSITKLGFLDTYKDGLYIAIKGHRE
jgi:ubiquinone/menaquinone biosynthesis C-methylase UbiE